MASINYTAEQINHRLELINENKNLLPYPYVYGASDLPNWLEDVGDGSFLVTETTTLEQDNEITLAPITLTSDASISEDFPVSIDITDIADKSVTSSVPGLGLKFGESTYHSGEAINLDNDVTTHSDNVLLVIPIGTYEEGWLIKPMIRKSSAEAGWIPYMKTIGDYVDERFNSTNIKIKKLNSDSNELSTLLSLIQISDVDE